MEDITSSVEKKGPKNYFPILAVSVGAIVTASVAISLLHIMFIKYCKRRHERDQTLSIESSTNIALDNRILNSIPILFYSSKTCHIYHIQDNQCVICLGFFTKGDLIRWLPNCGHIFHVMCIDNWFYAHITCPICRSLVHGACGGLCAEQGWRTRALPRTRSGGLLRHSTKLVLPIQGLRPCDLVKVGLKRSLSMDESSVVIDTREGSTSSSLANTNSNACNYPTLSKIDFLISRLYQAQSSTNRCSNYMSNMGFRSLNGVREGQGGTLRSNGILPY